MGLSEDLIIELGEYEYLWHLSLDDLIALHDEQQVPELPEVDGDLNE